MAHSISNNFQALTNDILISHVFPNLTGDDVKKCMTVCKVWLTAASDERVWQKLCKTELALLKKDEKNTWKEEYRLTLLSNLFKNGTLQCKSLQGHANEVREITLYKGFLASSDWTFNRTKSIHVWDLHTKSCLQTLKDKSLQPKLSFHGDQIAFLKYDNNHVHFWNWRTQQETIFKIIGEEIVESYFNGELISFFNQRGGEAKLFNWHENAVLPMSYNRYSGKFEPPIKDFENIKTPWLQGDFLLWEDYSDYSIVVMNWREEKISTVLHGHKGSVVSIAFQGNILVSGSSDETVKVWDWQANICLLTIEGTRVCDFERVNVSLDGHLVAFAAPGVEPIVQIWNWRIRECLHSFKETSGINVLLFKNMVISSYEKKINIWAFQKKKKSQSMIHNIKNFLSDFSLFSIKS